MMVPLEAQQQFESVLRNEQLGDRSQFSDPHVFEELPLYSRYEQIEFLSRFGDPNTLLLKLALDYLAEIVDTHVGAAEWLGAVTLWEDDSQDGDPIVPLIFVCNDEARRRLKDLNLQPATDKFAAFIKATLESAGKHDEMVVMADDNTIDGSVRYFISYKVPPRGMIGLAEFRLAHPRPT
ncbi:MAG TPA: Imm15 family immunity protein [Pirellulales bacterium]|jgi:hypothetical protein